MIERMHVPVYLLFSLTSKRPVVVEVDSIIESAEWGGAANR